MSVDAFQIVPLLLEEQSQSMMFKHISNLHPLSTQQLDPCLFYREVEAAPRCAGHAGRLAAEQVISQLSS